MVPEEESHEGTDDRADRRALAAGECPADPGGSGSRGDDPVARLFDERDLLPELLAGGPALFQLAVHVEKEYICRLLIIWN
jgi:hypothetical protein